MSRYGEGIHIMKRASTSLTSLLNGGSGSGTEDVGENADTLLAAIAAAAISFGAQIAVFYVLRLRMTRIYSPKTYLVPERFRVPSPPAGLYKWLVPLFTTPNSVFIEKCGLDAYFFLRYLRMLLKLFVPMSLLILPILLPINRYSAGPNTTAKGLDTLSWVNVGRIHSNRLWAHLVLAVMVICWFCYVVLTELRGYIRIRQAYLSSPQHRIRASATTVLVSGIPRKWLTLEALNGLYDVYPGGIRNIWINRNFDALSQKIKMRTKMAKKLEGAETSLMKKCLKAHKKAEQQKAKEEGRQQKTKAEKKQDDKREDTEADQLARGQGESAGDYENTPHNIHEMVDDIQHPERRSTSMDQLREEPSDRNFRNPRNPLSLVGAGFGAMGQGFTKFGNVGKNFLGDIQEDVGRVYNQANQAVDVANTGGAFTTASSQYDLAGNRISSANTTTTGTPMTPIFPTHHYAETDESTLQAHDEYDEEHGYAVIRTTTNAERQAGIRQVNNEDTAHHNSSSSDSEGRKGSGERGNSFEHLHRGVTGQDTAGKSAVASTMERLKAFRKAPPLPFPSPQPHMSEGDSYPLDTFDNKGNDPARQPNQRIAKSKLLETILSLQIWKKKKNSNKKDDDDDNDDLPEVEYDKAFNDELAHEDEGEPVWKKYIEVKDRDTVRMPLKSWMPTLPFLGKKEDKIYYLRRELARLNVEIEDDQKNPERFPFMNSAFIQFNHQVAAHMCCQTVSHHIPQHMTPRLVEISPSDIIWKNMSIMWWERLVRTGIVIVICLGLIVLYAIPVAFTGLLSQITTIAKDVSWLQWIIKAPSFVQGIIQGTLPPILLSIILSLVPMIFRLLVKHQGVPTGTNTQLGVQQYYFIFLFIQVFLVATLSSGLTAFISSVAKNPLNVVSQLADNLPKASNYFFSYLIVQAMGNSASALLQVTTLLFWFILGPILDSTPRAKWRRQTKLQSVNWGSFFPPYTNFAVIGLIYSVIAPLVMVFNLISFSLYWLVSRYNVLYVYQFTFDTGGLLFPTAVNQLFTGIYFLEVCLIGLFFLQKNETGGEACVGQAVIMIICLIFTAIYQYLLNGAFAPLFRYLPITLEDEAVIRDEEFAKAQNARFKGLTGEEPDEDEDIEDQLEARERREADEEVAAQEDERRRIKAVRTGSGSRNRSRQMSNDHVPKLQETKPTGNWKTDHIRKAVSKTQAATANVAALPTSAIRRFKSKRGGERPQSENGYSATRSPQHDADDADHIAATTEKPVAPAGVNPQGAAQDVEAQRTIGDVLFGGYSDELEDLTPEERDTLVRYSFQHIALRERRPVIWIPRDALGVSNDEIKRTKKMSTIIYVDEETEKRDRRTNIWISNDGAAINGNGKVVFRKSPPDFQNVDLISL